MVHVKILIDVKEYDRLKKIELEVRKGKQTQHSMEQEGRGMVSDEQLRTNIRNELATIAGDLSNTEVDDSLIGQEGAGKTATWRRLIREEMSRMLTPTDTLAPSASLKTPQGQPLPPITIPPFSEQVVFDEVPTTGPSTSSQDHVIPPPSYTDEDESWYYLGPI